MGDVAAIIQAVQTRTVYSPLAEKTHEAIGFSISPRWKHQSLRRASPIYFEIISPSRPAALISSYLFLSLLFLFDTLLLFD